MKTLLLSLVLALAAFAQLPPIRSATPGTTLPATCTVGNVFMKTDATAGQNWYFCTATDTWTQQLNSGGGGEGVTPSLTVAWLDDDLYPGSPSNYAVGMYGWNSALSTGINSEVDHPGIYRLTTGTTANSTAYIGTGYGAVKAIPPLDTTTNWEVVIIFRTGSSLSNAKLRVGLMSLSSFTEASPTVGAYIEHLSATSGCTSNPGSADTTWMYARGNGSITRAAGPAIATSTWYRLRIRSTTIGEFRMSLSTAGGAYSTEEVYTTGIPTVSLFAAVMAVTCDTSAKILDADKISYYQTGISR